MLFYLTRHPHIWLNSSSRTGNCTGNLWYAKYGGRTGTAGPRGTRNSGTGNFCLLEELPHPWTICYIFIDYDPGLCNVSYSLRTLTFANGPFSVHGVMGVSLQKVAGLSGVLKVALSNKNPGKFVQNSGKQSIAPISIGWSAAAADAAGIHLTEGSSH